MTIQAQLFDPRICELGEGPFWHPVQQQLYWFDILGMRLLTREGDAARHWQFDEHHSAAGWIDQDYMLIASETGLWRFDTRTGQRERICKIEATEPSTRSNDGRADPQGGFWIGTMGKSAETGMGSIYRYFQGEVRQLVSGMTIPNSICFAPGGRTAYFTDTAVGQIMKQALDPLGWPVGAASVFLDLGAQGIHPDGSVVDANGNLWNAQWGAGRVRCYDANGAVVKTVAVPGRHSSCPAFGGGEFETLFVTTAQEGIANPDASQGPVYFAKPDAKGQPEHRVQVPV